MSHRPASSPRPLALRPLALSLRLMLGGLAAAALAPQALAAEPAAAARSYQIAAGPLGDVLAQFAAQTGVRLSFDPALVAGLRSPGLQGSYGVGEGFARILAGSGYELADLGGGAYTLRKAPPPPGRETTLAPVTVTASAGAGAETALGPVKGYIATRSITASKSDIPLIETPQSVSIVTAEQIEVQNAESLAQALRYTSGVHPLGGDNTTSDGMVIRGFNVTGSAPMYLNGTKLSRNTFSGVSEPYAMERIELLKGPASVLYGNAAPGGIINMVSKLPQAETQREVRLQLGDYDRQQIAGDFTGALNEDGSLTYRLTGLVRRSDTSVDHVPDDRNFGAAALRWQPGADTSFTLFANYQENDTVYNYGLPASGTVSHNVNGRIPRDRFVGEPGFNKFETENSTVGYLFSHRFNEQLSFRQNLLYFTARSDYRDIWLDSFAATDSSIFRGAYTRNDKNRSWTVDNQLEGRFQTGAVAHTVLVGIDYSESEFKRLQYGGSAAPLDLYNPVYGSPVILNATPQSHFRENTRQLGIYAQDHMKIAERWVVMLGGRHDKVYGRSKDYLSGSSATDYDDDATTGRAGLVYLFDNGFAPYLSYAESFEPTTGRDAGGRAFKPTEGKQYEVGLRYQPAGQALSVTASAYQLTQTNVTTNDLNNPGEYIQEGEVESQGFEVELRAHFTERLSVIAAYGYVDNKVTKSDSGTKGNRSASVPMHTASVWADYQLTPALKLGGGLRYYGESYDGANTAKAPDFTVADAMLSYQFTPQWQLSLNINNLFDERYATCSYACFYGASRSAVATATYRW
ncbi:TonB-dependent siderophore receptor [Azoarcus indigens]|uniref:Iron complex outermembrane receptor protein n=1 Tax=Azoarcus indigens TaxID=29545 RepID=A0A4R6DJV1_9RHOO|nr:TonB-dependent siderophore receptor [Azoarcus indigens]NMG67285.1 TonB-dependent siderophore receptor [Azoarcus indigens]TDN44980.1 iron complex outermembrane receptor protein [Azoarcus indigens]